VERGCAADPLADPAWAEMTEAAARTVESVVEPVDPESAGRRRTSRISPNLTS
jgi:hypothetical protein